jgi:hypothetical protein
MDAMYWQAAAGDRFRMPEGDVFVPGPYLGPPPSYIGDTLTGLGSLHYAYRPPAAANRQRALEELAKWQVRTVVVGPTRGHADMIHFFTAVLGRAPTQSGGVDVWWDVDPAAVQASLAGSWASAA